VTTRERGAAKRDATGESIIYRGDPEGAKWVRVAPQREEEVENMGASIRSLLESPSGSRKIQGQQEEFEMFCLQHRGDRVWNANRLRERGKNREK